MKTQSQLKQLGIIYQNQSIFVFLDIAKLAESRCKKVDASRTQKVCHVIYIYFASSLGKV